MLQLERVARTILAHKGFVTEDDEEHLLETFGPLD